MDGSGQRDINLLYGIKLGHETTGKSVTENLGVEGTLNYFNTRSKTDGGNDTGYLFRIDATYPFPFKKKWMPFLAVGVGGIFTDSTPDSRKNFLLNYGGGVKYFFENYLALRVDARQLGVFENSIFRKNHEISIGLSYYFGKERAKKTVPPPVPVKKKIVVLEDVPAKIEEVAKPADTAAAAIEVVPPNVEPPVSPVVKNEILKKFSVEFGSTSSQVKPNYFGQFKEIADTLKASADFSAQIVGQGDLVGKLAANIKLSEQRAKSVRSNLIKLGVKPEQISITDNEAAKSISEKDTIDRRQQNSRVDILIVKLDATTKIMAEQKLQFKAEQNEIERLQIEKLARTRVKAAVVLQEVSGALPADSDSTLSFEVANQGSDTEEFVLTLIAPKEFDGFLARANRPDEKITLLHLAPGETFKGSVLFRIPAGMADGYRTTLSVRAVSTKFNDVSFQKESLVICSAPLVRVAAKLSKREVNPGEKLRYSLTVQNTGSLSARNLSVRLQLPSQVDFIGAPDLVFTQEAPGMILFKIDTIESGKLAEINVDMKVREDSAIGQELLWNVEVIEGNLKRRAKSTERASVVKAK
jgi:uncharacterized repeat protein (TIGR01451 family)